MYNVTVMRPSRYHGSESITPLQCLVHQDVLGLSGSPAFAAAAVAVRARLDVVVVVFAVATILLLKGGEHGVELGLEVGEVGLELCGGLLAPELRVSTSQSFFFFSISCKRMQALIPLWQNSCLFAFACREE